MDTRNFTIVAYLCELSVYKLCVENISPDLVCISLLRYRL